MFALDMTTTEPGNEATNRTNNIEPIDDFDGL